MSPSVDANPASCSTSGECLTYDALGRMVEKTVGSTYTQIVYGPQGRFATMNGQTFASAFIPLPGSQAVYTSASLNTTNKVAYYRHTDHLGSSRLAATPTQTLYSSTAYAPFGESYSQAGATDLSFTGQEQDTVSGIHDFPERKYPTVQGRWLSPDPAGLGAVDPANPQSWNRYAYVLNNPLALVDPLGLDGCTQQVSGGACLAANPAVPSESGNFPNFGQPNLAAITGSAGFGPMGPQMEGGLGSIPGFGSDSGAAGGFIPMGIFEGENSTSYSLGPSPLQILQDLLSGNFSDLGVPTLGQLMNNAWVMDATPGGNCTPGTPHCFNVPQCQNGSDLTLELCAAGCGFPQAALNAFAAICPLTGKDLSCSLTLGEEANQQNRSCMNNCMQSWAQRNKCGQYFKFDVNMNPTLQ